MSGYSHDADEIIGYIASNVRRLRLSHDLTQEALSEAAGIDLTYAQRIERGTANPSVKVLVSIANVFDVPVARLFRRASKQTRRAGRPTKQRQG